MYLNQNVGSYDSYLCSIFFASFENEADTHLQLPSIKTIVYRLVGINLSRKMNAK